MSGLEFLSATIGQFVWPVFIVVLVLILKDPIKKIASSPRLKSLKAGPSGVEVEFREELTEAEKELHTGEPGTADVAPSSQPPEITDFIGEMTRLAEVSPRAVVLETHARLEKLLREAVGQPLDKSPGLKRLTMRGLAREAVNLELLSKSEASVLDELSYLRNSVAHEPDHVITPQDALRYARLATQIALSLRGSNGQTILDGPPL